MSVNLLRSTLRHYAVGVALAVGVLSALQSALATQTTDSVVAVAIAFCFGFGIGSLALAIGRQSVGARTLAIVAMSDLAGAIYIAVFHTSEFSDPMRIGAAILDIILIIACNRIISSRPDA